MAFLLCLYLVTVDGDCQAYLLPDQIRERFTRTTAGGKAVYRLSLTATLAKALGADMGSLRIAVHCENGRLPPLTGQD